MIVTTEFLRERRAKLEVEYAAKRSLLDQLIDHSETTAKEPPAIVAEAPTASTTVTIVPPPTKARPSKAEAKAKRAPRAGNVRDQVRHWIGQRKEFTTTELAKAFPMMKPGSRSSAVTVMQEAGEIRRLSHGRYERTDRLGLTDMGALSAKELAYRHAREEMSIQPAPDQMVRTVMGAE